MKRLQMTLLRNAASWLAYVVFIGFASQVIPVQLASAEGPAVVQVGVPNPPAAPAVAVSSPTASSDPTLEDIFPISRLHVRDPFAQLGGGGGGSSSASVERQGVSVAAFSIHNLILKGIMEDAAGDFALFVDASAGTNYVLKKGVLYNNKNRPVPGVSGIIKPQQKSVHLLTTDQDVQTFVLGEERGPE